MNHQAEKEKLQGELEAARWGQDDYRAKWHLAEEELAAARGELERVEGERDALREKFTTQLVRDHLLRDGGES